VPFSFPSGCCNQMYGLVQVNNESTWKWVAAESVGDGLVETTNNREVHLICDHVIIYNAINPLCLHRCWQVPARRDQNWLVFLIIWEPPM
jgi:hypothetical protein